MAKRVYQCSQCNTEFEFDSTRDALFCPLCGAAARVTNKKPSTTTTTTNNTTTTTTQSSPLNNATSTVSSSSSLVAVKFTDAATKTAIGSANIPLGWKYGAEIQNTFQSQEEPFVYVAQVTNSDNSITMFVRNGENFIDVRNGIGEGEVHKDGQIDKYFNTPMKRLTAFEDYITTVAQAYNNAKLTKVGSAKLPSYYGNNESAHKKLWTADAQDMAARFKNSQVTFEAVNQVNESTLVQYKYVSNRRNNIMMVGADVGGFEFHLTPVSQNTGNNMMGILSSLIGGGQQQAAANQGVYISWGSKLIFGLMTDESHSQEAVQAFSNFVGSFKQDKAIDTLKQRYISQGTTAADNTTTTTSNNTSQGLDMTSILMNLLNMSNNSSRMNIGEAEKTDNVIDITKFK